MLKLHDLQVGQRFTFSDLQDVENRVNNFIADKDVVNVNVSVTPMHDLYSNQEPTVCNQWIEFTATVLYRD